MRNFLQQPFWFVTPQWTVSGGVATASGTSSSLVLTAAQAFSLTEGKLYVVEMIVSAYTGGSVAPIIGGVELSNGATATGTYKYLVRATASQAATDTHGLKGTSFTGSVTSLSVKEAHVDYVWEEGGAVEAALTLGVDLTQAQVAELSISGSVLLSHSLAQDENAGWNTDTSTNLDATLAVDENAGWVTGSAVSLDAQLAESSNAEWDANASVSMDSQLGDSENAGWSSDSLVALEADLAQAQNVQWDANAATTLPASLAVTPTVQQVTEAVLTLAAQLAQTPTVTQVLEAATYLDVTLTQDEEVTQDIGAAITLAQQLAQAQPASVDILASLGLSVDLGHSADAGVVTDVVLALAVELAQGQAGVLASQTIEAAVTLASSLAQTQSLTADQAAALALNTVLQQTQAANADMQAALLLGIDLQLGRQIINDPTCDTPGDWSAGTGWSVSGGKIHASSVVFTSIDANNLNFPVVPGKTYVVRYTVSNYSAGTFYPSLGGTGGTPYSSNGTFQDFIVPAGTGTFKFWGYGNCVADFDDVTVIEFFATVAETDYVAALALGYTEAEVNIAGWDTSSTTSLGIGHSVDPAVVWDANAATTLPASLAVTPTVQQVIETTVALAQSLGLDSTAIASIEALLTLAAQHTQTQSAGGIFNAALSLGHRLFTEQDYIPAIYAALSLGVVLAQTDTVDWDVYADVALPHSLDQTQASNLIAEGLVSLDTAWAQIGVGTLITDADVTLAHSLLDGTIGNDLHDDYTITVDHYTKEQNWFWNSFPGNISYNYAGTTGFERYISIDLAVVPKAQTVDGAYYKITVQLNDLSIQGNIPASACFSIWAGWSGETEFIYRDTLLANGDHTYIFYLKADNTGQGSDNSIYLGFNPDNVGSLGIVDFVIDEWRIQEWGHLPEWNTFASASFGIDLAQTQVTGQALLAALTLGIQLTQAQDPQWDAQAALTLAQGLAEAVSVTADMSADVSLDHALGASPIAQMLAEGSVTLSHTMEAAPSVTGVLVAVVALAHSMAQAEQATGSYGVDVLLQTAYGQSQVGGSIVNAALNLTHQLDATQIAALYQILEAAVSFGILQATDSSNTLTAEGTVTLDIQHAVAEDVTQVAETSLTLSSVFSDVIEGNADFLEYLTLATGLSQSQVEQAVLTHEASLALGVAYGLYTSDKTGVSYHTRTSANVVGVLLATKIIGTRTALVSSRNRKEARIF